MKSVAIDSIFQCNICGVKRESRVHLRRHVARVHEKRYTEKKREKKFSCEELNCEKAFRSLVLLEDHLNRHRGMFLYVKKQIVTILKVL